MILCCDLNPISFAKIEEKKFGVFQTGRKRESKMTGFSRYQPDEMDYMTAAATGGYSSDSDLGQLSAGEETDDASESESYNHQVSKI